MKNIKLFLFLFLSEQVSAKTDWPSELVLMSFAFAVKCHLHLGHVTSEASVLFFLSFVEWIAVETVSSDANNLDTVAVAPIA